jgi:glycosyltransferase involved in cell wall biosynthesis
MPGITVIAPVYNEPDDIEPFIKRVSEQLAGQDYEIVIAEDGSNDAPKAIKRLGAKRCRVLHSDSRLGRGAALTKAILDAKSDIVVYMDVDLSSDLGKISRLISGIESGAAISTGSRLMANSDTKRGFLRDFMSRGYNSLVRIALGSRLNDHQCGFKAFRKSAVIPVLKKVKDTHWFWDTEILVRAQREGLSVDEFPIVWNEEEGSKVNLLKDTVAMAKGIAGMVLDG